MLVVVPIHPVDDRKETHAFDRYAGVVRAPQFRGDLAQPLGPPDADVARLANEQRPTVSVNDLGEDPMKRLPSRVARRVFPPQSRVGVFPLIRVVKIDAHDVEITGMPAEFRRGHAREHVPRLELALPLIRRSLGQVRTHHWRYDVNDRIDVHNPRAAVNLPDRLAAADDGFDELSLELRSSSSA